MKFIVYTAMCPSSFESFSVEACNFRSVPRKSDRPTVVSSL